MVLGQHLMSGYLDLSGNVSKTVSGGFISRCVHRCLQVDYDPALDG